MAQIAVEKKINSEDSAYRDMVQKKKLYAKFGLKEYWVVIPGDEEIEIYTLKDNAYHLYKAHMAPRISLAKRLKDRINGYILIRNVLLNI